MGTRFAPTVVTFFAASAVSPDGVVVRQTTSHGGVGSKKVTQSG